jgi:ParB-like nuclease domain
MPDKTPPVEYVNLDQLELDPDNPRLPQSEGRSRREIIDYLARSTSIEELMEAIGKNDYFPGEPLIVARTKKPKLYRVVEGNRRLTALLLLQDPKLASKNQQKLAELAKQAKFRPTKVPVVIFDARDDVMTYLGYRHITGVKAWGPLAKARYMYQLFEDMSSPRSSAASRYTEVAQMIGSRRSFVKRTLDALALYNVIEKKKFFGIPDLDEKEISFSLISTATGYEHFLEFLLKDRDAEPIINPSAIRQEHLKQFTEWLFKKDEKGNTRLGESRQLSKLNLIVATSDALREFRKGASIERAFRLTRGIDEEFATHLDTAETELEGANAIVANVTIGDINRDAISRISNLASLLKKIANEDK